MNWPMSSCRSCGAPVRWAKTTDGKSMPLDPDPAAGGNVAVIADREATTRAGSTIPVVRVDDLRQMALCDPGVRYVAHFATCPDSDKWRRR